MQCALIGLGGNVGDVAESIRTAAQLIERGEGCGAVRTSRLFRSAAVGSAAGSSFLNAAIALETSLGARPLLERLQHIEGTLGRVRSVHWGPRVIDLDLVGLGEQVISTPALTVPHRHCWYRRFVLDPLMDVAPDWRHPVLGRTVAQLRERLLVRPLPVCMQGDPGETGSAVRSAYGGSVSVHTDGGTGPGELWISIGSPTPSAFSLKVDGEHAADEVVEVLRAALDVPEPLSA